MCFGLHVHSWTQMSKSTPGSFMCLLSLSTFMENGKKEKSFASLSPICVTQPPWIIHLKPLYHNVYAPSCARLQPCTQGHCAERWGKLILSNEYYSENNVLLLAEMEHQSEHLPVTADINSAEDPSKLNSAIQAVLIQYDFYSSNSQQH